MDGALEAHRRYLATLRDSCSHHPVPHSHQLAAIDREIEIAGGARDLAGYTSSSGNLFELTRARWLDRLANQARVAVAVGDPWQAEAAALEYRGALAATGPDDWPERVAAGSAGAMELLDSGTVAVAAFTRLLQCLLAVNCSGREIERATWRNLAVDSLGALRKADPEFTWSGSHNRSVYRSRTPWTGTALEVVGRWMHELLPDIGAASGERTSSDPLAEIEAGEERWQAGLAQPPSDPAPPGEPTLEGLIAPYRELAALPGDDRPTATTRQAAQELVDAVVDAPGPREALAVLVADGLLASLAAAPLRARAGDALERQTVWPDALVDHHWRALVQALSATRTPTEVELVSIHAEACLGVEADWNEVLLDGLTAPLRAAFVYGWEGTDASAGVTLSAAAARALTGLGARSLLELARVADFVDRIVTPHAPVENISLGAFEGEAGFELLGDAGTWVANLREQDEPVPGDLRAALSELLDRSGVEEPSPAALPVVLWGTVISLEELQFALTRPARPEIPGMEAVPRSPAGLS